MSWEIAAMAVSTGVKMLGAIKEGNAKASALQSEANIRIADAKQEKRLARIEALDEELERRREAAAVFGRNLTRDSVGGGNPYSSNSFAAIQLQNTKNMEADVTSIRLLGAARRQKASNEISMANSLYGQARAARTSGYLKAVGAAADGGGKIYKMSK